MKMILTNDDVTKIWSNLKIISLYNVKDFIKDGGVEPMTMSNGYTAAMTIDILSEYISIYHLSINNPKGKTSDVTAQRMAYEILGDGYTQLDRKNISGCVQFIKKKEI